MKFTIVKEPIPFLLIEDLFNEDELQKIYRELEFLHPKLLDPDNTGSAKNIDGSNRKKNKGVFLEQVYVDRQFSDILCINRKLFGQDIFAKLNECSVAYGIFNHLNIDTTLISYYEDTDHYKSHCDAFTIISMCTWFFQEPKNFLGGDFKFSDYNITIPVKNNQSVIFFSHFKHEVSEIKMIDKFKTCSGRFSMSMFARGK
jgi:Rps23 Pro-64 3,4-dihydroxylase Tpa1-like proline 4-hydroxylase